MQSVEIHNPYDTKKTRTNISFSLKVGEIPAERNALATTTRHWLCLTDTGICHVVLTASLAVAVEDLRDSTAEETLGKSAFERELVLLLQKFRLSPGIEATTLTCAANSWSDGLA
jgi:hypothetical protein